MVKAMRCRSVSVSSRSGVSTSLKLLFAVSCRVSPQRQQFARSQARDNELLLELVIGARDRAREIHAMHYFHMSFIISSAWLIHADSQTRLPYFRETLHCWRMCKIPESLCHVRNHVRQSALLRSLRNAGYRFLLLYTCAFLFFLYFYEKPQLLSRACVSSIWGRSSIRVAPGSSVIQI